jgi:hypothetical protein
MGKDGAIRSKRFDMHWIWEFYKLVDKLLRIAAIKMEQFALSDQNGGHKVGKASFFLSIDFPLLIKYKYNLEI